MRIPDKFIKKHARPGETMGQARRRLMRQLKLDGDVHSDPAAALKRLDEKLLEQAEAKLREQWKI